MRTRKLKLSDLRFSARGQLIAAPAWAYEPFTQKDWLAMDYHGRRTYRVPLIDELWEDVWAELKKNKQFVKLQSTYRCWQPQWDHAPDSKFDFGKTCVVCGKHFYGLGPIATCTDKCGKARRDATRTRGEWRREPVVHEPRKCEVCGEEFTPARNDAKFCSGRCRVAHHRQQQER